MSQQRPEHASKVRASENMTTMIAVPSPAFTETEEEEILLRFAKDLWNEYQPLRQETTSSSTRSKEVGNQKRRPTTVETDDDPTIEVPKRSPAQPKQCKVKVTRFQYGGPKANIEGQHMNNITMMAPCLQPTCANCCEWHPNLMRNPPLVNACLDNKHITQPTEIDPTLLDNTWQTYQSQHNSMSNVTGRTVPSECAQQPATPAQAPVDRVLEAQGSFNKDVHLLTIRHCDETATDMPQNCNTLLPVSLLFPTAPTVSNKVRTVKLRFPTDKGKSKFKNLLHERVRKDIKREYDRLRRTTKQLIRQAMSMGEQDAVVASMRRRHKAKLIFRSMKGREAYGRLVERYSS